MSSNDSSASRDDRTGITMAVSPRFASNLVCADHRSVLVDEYPLPAESVSDLRGRMSIPLNLLPGFLSDNCVSTYGQIKSWGKAPPQSPTSWPTLAPA